MRKWIATLAVCAAALAVTIPVAHIDATNQNWNAAETRLTSSNVTAGKFGKLGSYSLDGYGYAQPLFVPGVVIGGAPHDIWIAATMHNSVYAFDAAAPGAAALWHAGPLATSRTSYPGIGDLGGLYYGLEQGCAATPAVDVDNGWVFAVCTNSTPTHVLYKLNLSTGATISSATITATVPGTGDPTGGDMVSGGNLTFYPDFELGRSSLQISGGKVYASFGSQDDTHPWHGWAFAYTESSMAQSGAWCVTPNGYGGGLWQAGGGPAIDGSGNVYFVTGNGDYDGTSNYGQSVVRLSSTLGVVDSFTPSDWATLNNTDVDIGSCRPMLLPGGRVVACSKNYKIYNVSTSCMGLVGGTNNGCTAPQTITTDAGSSFGLFESSYMNGVGFFGAVGGDKIYAYPFSGGSFNTGTAYSSTLLFPFPGAVLTGSSNAATHGIIWTVLPAASAHTAPQQGTLYALNPADLTEYWDSSQSGNDALGVMVKFSSPTVANGRVAVTTSNALVVYGLLSGASVRGKTSVRGAATIK